MKEKTGRMLVLMVIIAIALAILTVIFFLLYRQAEKAWLLSAAITCLTVFYHFAMRLLVGETITLIFRGKEFPQDRLGFRQFGFEKTLYKKLKVKKWKANAVTAKPEQFDLRLVSPEELLHNVMQAELVHRVIMVLSFVPLLFIIPFGAPAVFITTSIGACLIDAYFTVIQRYNRPRVLRYIKLSERKNGSLRGGKTPGEQQPALRTEEN